MKTKYFLLFSCLGFHMTWWMSPFLLVSVSSLERGYPAYVNAAPVFWKCVTYFDATGSQIERNSPQHGSGLVSHPFLILMSWGTLGFSFDSGTSKDRDSYGDAVSILFIVRQDMNWDPEQTTIHVWTRPQKHIWNIFSMQQVGWVNPRKRWFVHK